MRKVIIPVIVRHIIYAFTYASKALIGVTDTQDRDSDINVHVTKGVTWIENILISAFKLSTRVEPMTYRLRS